MQEIKFWPGSRTGLLSTLKEQICDLNKILISLQIFWTMWSGLSFIFDRSVQFGISSTACWRSECVWQKLTVSPSIHSSDKYRKARFKLRWIPFQRDSYCRHITVGLSRENVW